MPRVLKALALTLALLAFSACTTSVPKRYLPFPLTNDTFEDPVKVVSIPLPAFETDPNAGITVGALGAFLLYNAKNEASTILAPQMNWNKYFGVTGTIYGGFYPKPGRFFEVNLSQSEKVNHDASFLYRDRTFLSGKLEIEAGGAVTASGAERFFGFSSSSSQADESNYDDSEKWFRVAVGYEILKNFQVFLADRWRDVDVKEGAIKSLPFIRDVFTTTEVPGINGFQAHGQSLGFVYSTLDDRSMPTRGVQVKGSVEALWKALGSSSDYRRYEAEAKAFFPLDNARFVTAGRLLYVQALGDEVSFLERARLGGAQTLRGYGTNRFIDNSALLLNVEERIRLFRWEIFGVDADWEVAPFLDVGAVMHDLTDFRGKTLKAVPGVAFRAVVRPNVVGHVDVGYGDEGPAVFIGLGYPF